MPEPELIDWRHPNVNLLSILVGLGGWVPGFDDLLQIAETRSYLAPGTVGGSGANTAYSDLFMTVLPHDVFGLSIVSGTRVTQKLKALVALGR